MYQQPRTMLSDLPDADQLDAIGDSQMDTRDQQMNMGMQKVLRDTHKPMQESGMYADGPNRPYGPPTRSGHASFGEAELPQEQIVMPTIPDYMRYSCIDVSLHIDNCPICSKLYKNDNTIHIIAIIVLSIICLLLIKRVLNV